MLIGEYNHSIDEKGRVRIPKNFRDDLGETFYVTKGFDKCLFVYSEENWRKFQEKLSQNQMSRKDYRKIQHFFFGSAIEGNLDGQGRVTLSQALREFSMLDKEVVVVGMNDRAEIWSKESWIAYQEELEDVSELAEDLPDLNI